MGILHLRNVSESNFYKIIILVRDKNCYLFPQLRGEILILKLLYILRENCAYFFTVIVFHIENVRVQPCNNFLMREWWLWKELVWSRRFVRHTLLVFRIKILFKPQTTWTLSVNFLSAHSILFNNRKLWVTIDVPYINERPRQSKTRETLSPDTLHNPRWASTQTPRHTLPVTYYIYKARRGASGNISHHTASQKNSTHQQKSNFTCAID